MGTDGSNIESPESIGEEAGRMRAIGEQLVKNHEIGKQQRRTGGREEKLRYFLSARPTNMTLAFLTKTMCVVRRQGAASCSAPPRIRITDGLLVRVIFLFQCTVPVGPACNRKRVSELTTTSNLWKYK
jgi:hypothetical protein